MFEQEIINLGFKQNLLNKSYELEFDDFVFLYIYSFGEIYYVYYGRNRLAHYMHGETTRDYFIKMILSYKSFIRDEKIDNLMDNHTGILNWKLVSFMGIDPNESYNK